MSAIVSYKYISPLFASNFGSGRGKLHSVKFKKQKDALVTV
jgi:hypothetical protein